MHDPQNRVGQDNTAEEQKSLPNPMDTPEIESPKEHNSNAPMQQIVVKKGLLSHPFVATMFLAAFFLTAFSSGWYAQKSMQLEDLVASGGTGQVAQAQDQGPGLSDGKKVEQDIPIDTARVKGNPNAKVTIIEYSDFECPFCESFYKNAYKQIVQKYVDSGQVKIAFKDFPLSFHPMAQSSAEASRCAAEQGKFWEMHDRLFENQKILSIDNYKKWGTELGLNAQQFNSCVDSKKYQAAVEADLQEGMALGVEGTPSFLINGVALVGAQPLSAFEKVIDEALK